MNPLAILTTYHDPGLETARILIIHSVLVAQKALRIGEKVAAKEPADLKFIYEAAMLHDIGYGFPALPDNGADEIVKEYPEITSAYIAHGFYGAQILRCLGLPKHASVAERHVGVGLTKEAVLRNKWPIPARDYRPQTIEEEIISYADLFYSKKAESLFKEEPREAIIEELGRYGKEDVATFLGWEKRFS